VLLKGSKLTMIGAAGMVLAAGAAQAEGPKFGLEYRAGLTYDDGKIHETKGADAEDSSFTEIEAESAKVTATGEAAKDVTYRFRYNALNSAVEHANTRLQFNKMMGFTVGRTKVNQGGWHAKDSWNEYNNTESRCGDQGATNIQCEGDFAFAYANSQAFKAFDDVVALHLALAGELSVQFLNDVDPGKYGYSNKGPAATIEWVGNFNGWMPLVQISSYERNKSQAFSVGVKGNAAGLGLALGYNLDNRKMKTGDETNTHTGIDVHVDYAVGGWTPWVAFHSFDVKQGGTDADTNSSPTPLTEAQILAGEKLAHSSNVDDNGQAIAVGVQCNALGDGYIPYASIISSSGKYAEAGTGDEETRNGLALKVGVMGKF
jgi:hypothetical protein